MYRLVSAVNFMAVVFFMFESQPQMSILHLIVAIQFHQLAEKDLEIRRVAEAMADVIEIKND